VADQIKETPQYHNGVEALLELLTAPSYLPVSRPAPLLPPQTSDQISCESTRPPPQNQCIPASTASTDNRKDRYHPRRKNKLKSKDKSPQPIEPHPKKKFTKLRQRIKNSIVIIWKRFTFQVSSPREPLENYDISRNTASASTNIRRDSMLRPLSYLGAACPLMLPLLSPPSLCVPTGPLYRIYRTNFGRCRDLDA
jgi:hypothetical protein